MRNILFSKRFQSLVGCLLILYCAHAKEPQRIISLAPSITKNLYLLHLENKIVGYTNYCDLGNKYDKPIVASALDVNIEKIVSLKPDLILASSLTKPETLDMFKKLGMRLVYMPLPKSFKDIEDQFVELAELTNTKAIAEKILFEEQQKRNKLYSHIHKEANFKVFMQIGAIPLWCVIPDTFMDDFITYSGCVNIANDLKNGAISRESVIVRNPDVIFIVSMGNIGTEESKIWNSYKSLSAVKNNRVFVLDSDLACSPSPVDITETMRQIITKIYMSK